MLCSSAFAADSTTYPGQAQLELHQLRASAQIRQYATSLSVTGTSEMTAYYAVYGTSNSMLEIGAYSISIQKQVTSTRWQTVATYDGTSSTNTWAHAQDVTFATSPGVSYRAVFELFATNSDGTDSRTLYSAIKIA